MKILAIRINNLASLEGRTEIDFTIEPLCSAGIFAITGPTGAGKSTILDALCLALYAKTPRYVQAKAMGIEVLDVGENKISQGDVRGILRDGTAEGFAEVDFVGVDKSKYRATWNIRRARSKVEGSLQNFTMSLKNLSSNIDVPGRRTELLVEIERLVGLNFEQFSRSVLLAQGDFTAFLKAPKDEKSSLLEKLTGTYIYSKISLRIFEKHKSEAQELHDLNLKREGILTLTEEELDSFTQQIIYLQSVITDQEKQAELLSLEINWHTQSELLKIQLATANEKYTQAIEIKKNAIDREEKLKQVERIQPARKLVDAKQYTEKQLREKISNLEGIEKTLIDLYNQKKDQEELLYAANEDVKAKTRANELARPQIEEAKKLDIQLSDKVTQVAEATKDRDATLKIKNQHEVNLKGKQQETDLLLLGIDELKKWKDENITRKDVADNQSLIASKLSDAQKQLNTLQKLLNQIELGTSNIDKLTKEKGKLTEASITQFQEVREAQEVSDKLLKNLSATDFTAVENEKIELSDSLEELIRAEAHWKLLSNKLNDSKELDIKLTRNKATIKHIEVALKDSVDLLAKLRTQQDSSLQMLNKARLAAAENVEKLRLQLAPGEACPVCGSEEHPYALHNPQLDHVLKELEAMHQKNEVACTEKLKQLSSEEASYKQLQILISEQELQSTLNQSALDILQSRWKDFTIQKEFAQIPIDEQLTWISSEINNKRAQQNKLIEALQTYNNKKKLLENQQQLVLKLTKQQIEDTNKIKDIDRDLKSLEDQLNNFKADQQKLKEELSATEKMLSPFFTSPDWFSQWKINPDKFIEHLNSFAIKWKSDNQKLDKYIANHSVLLETLRSMIDRSQILQTELEKKETILNSLNNLVIELTKQRELILDGEAAQVVETRLQKAIEMANHKLDILKENREALQISLTRHETQKEQTLKEVSSLTQQQKTNVEALQQWLTSAHTKNASSLTEVGLIQLLEATPEWIESERAFLRTLDDSITQTRSVFDERVYSSHEHEKLRISDRHRDELNELLAVVKESLKNSNEQKNKIQFQLDQDSANKKAIGGLLNTINVKALIVEDWAKLNDIIGSADGKKFRQIAQEYTLDILLGYANVHLEILSKRYLLQRIPDSLGLQVIDQDMGNEIRTVFSLSGGESFLVSLALALGLASLSSTRMQVESLFIDEGFGSLDPATLNIAMDALERLHNQGRKVGVISHLQEMTERIPVQIKVNKENSGRSRVEIIS